MSVKRRDAVNGDDGEKEIITAL